MNVWNCGSLIDRILDNRLIRNVWRKDLCCSSKYFYNDWNRDTILICQIPKKGIGKV